MNFNDVLSEISTPTGHIFLRFGAKDTGQKDEHGNPKQYLVGWAGFGNSPDQVHYGNARVKFNKLTSAEDVVKAVKEVLGDTQFGKVFISAKTLIIVPPKKIPDDAGFLGKFFDWVRREGGDRISLYQKDDPTSAPPEKPDEKVTVKRKKKPNPMFGKKNPKRSEMNKLTTGDRHPMYGKKHSEETLIKFRFPKSEQHKQRLSKSRKGKYAGENHPMYGRKYKVQEVVKQFAFNYQYNLGELHVRTI